MDAELVALLYEDKLKKLLTKFLEPAFEIKTDTYLNVLLSHLSGKDDKEFGETLTNLPIFTEWIFKSVTLWEDGNPLPPTNIIAFLFQILSLLSKDEAHFNTFNSYNMYSRLCTIVKAKDSTFSVMVQLAYTKLLTSFLHHKSGMSWLTAHESWGEILDLSLKGQTVYIVREGHNFIYQLLFKASTHDGDFCNTIINKVMLIFDEVQSSNTVILEVNGEHLQEKLIPSLKLISYILENFLESEAFAKQEYHVPSIFVKSISLQEKFWNTILTGINNKDLVYELSRVLILSNFFKIAIECETPLYEYKENQKMIAFILQLLQKLILKYDNLTVLKVGYISQYYWHHITPRLKNILERRKQLPIIFDLQVIIFQIFPILAISYKYCDFNMEAATETGSFRDEFISKNFTTWSEDTIRWIYRFRKHLEDDAKNIFENAQKSFMYVMKSRPYLKREAAILAFRFFIYILKDATRVMSEKRDSIDIFMSNSGYLATHLDAISVFMQEYDITWKESIETISIMNILMKFVKLAQWPYRVTVQILKLANLTIARFATPNLILLVDTTSNSELANLGPVLTAKLHDTSWEVRDSALEVLYTICAIAHTKFPSFKNWITEHDLPQLVITMGLHDSESFVRASALQCLMEMIFIKDVWETVLLPEEIPRKMLEILYNETEGIVRCEAASVVTAVYTNHFFDASLMESINQAMVYTATLDLHWEVKLKALLYWNSVVDNCLSNQGMIDGAFPEVTFSGEHKKIVTLTNEEIRNRLNKILVQLSECGCLYVLKTNVQDDSDIEVSKKAVEITKKLSCLLDKYNVTYTGTPIRVKDHSSRAVNSTTLQLNNCQSLRSSDDVIDEIVNTRDVQLLPQVFVGNCDTTYKSKTYSKSTNHCITPQEFLSFIKSDLDTLINQRKNWLNNIDDLGSLLDDMLKTYEIPNDINAMDCY